MVLHKLHYQEFRDISNFKLMFPRRKCVGFSSLKPVKGSALQSIGWRLTLINAIETGQEEVILPKYTGGYSFYFLKHIIQKLEQVHTCLEDSICNGIYTSFCAKAEDIYAKTCVTIPLYFTPNHLVTKDHRAADLKRSNLLVKVAFSPEIFYRRWTWRIKERNSASLAWERISGQELFWCIKFIKHRP